MWRLAKRVVVFGVFLTLAACAASTPQAAEPVPASYPGNCWLLDIEHSEGPAADDQDTIQLVARYRASEGEGAGPIRLAFRVTRGREEALRAHLQNRAEVTCRPGDAQTPPSVAVEPFEGQAGEPLAAEPER